MARPNDTGDEETVAMHLPAHHEKFLRHVLSLCKAGIEGDLAANPPLPARRRGEREAAAFGRLLDGLRDGELVPDGEMVYAATKLAEQTDSANAYEQVMLEHRALCGLVGLLEEGRRR